MAKVIGLNNTYPCCGHEARFSPADAESRRVDRRCTKCGTAFTVVRKKGRVQPWGIRFDTLEWKEHI